MTTRAGLNLAYHLISDAMDSDARAELDESLLSPAVQAANAREARIEHARALGALDG